MTSHDHQPPPPAAPLGPTAVKLRLAMYVALAVLVALNLFILPHEPHFGIDGWPGFWAVFGVVVAVGLGRLAKGAAHTFLGQDEDFYQRREPKPAPAEPVVAAHGAHGHGGH